MKSPLNTGPKEDPMDDMDGMDGMDGTTVRDKVFKTVILALLTFSTLIQVSFSAWFYDKLKTLESHLSTYPVNKPVTVDLGAEIPELVETNRKIDRLTEQLDTALNTPQAFQGPERNTPLGTSSKPARKKANSRQSTGYAQVEVIERIGK